ncbi:MAG: beta-propeller domain-containing protein, partial [Polyangiaceae bacterium]
MLAHPDLPATDGGYVVPTQSDLQYLDISDPGGQIVERGTLQVGGVVDTSGPDSGRWNLDFADGKTAHLIACASGQYGCGGANGSYVLSTADFSAPDAPKLDSALSIPATGWSVSARFDSNRMYLSPSTYGYGTTIGSTTPLDVFDLSNPAAPVLAGQTQVPGNVWLMVPSGNQLFALGSDQSQNSSQVALSYLDVTSAASPKLIGTSSFGEGWASTPAAGTFKAFTMDPNRLGPSHGLVVLPFSGWDASNSGYNNGVQLVEFTPSSITTDGAAHTKGWVERGIFVNGRIVSLSDLALSVVDYSNPAAPKVTAQLTLARSVVTAQPSGSTIAQVSSDWWDNDVSHSDVRVLPIADAEESKDESNAPDTAVDGVGANVFTNGSLEYIVTNVQIPVPCGQPGAAGVRGPVASGAASAPVAPQTCTGWEQQVQVVDLSNGGAKLRGKIALPANPYGGYAGWGWAGFYDYDWYNGADVVQVGGNALAFRRWSPDYNVNGAWNDAASDLFVVDLSNPDAPHFASTVITHDPTGWWGDMRVVGTTLYTSHEEWIASATTDDSGGPAVSGSSSPGSPIPPPLAVDASPSASMDAAAPTAATDAGVGSIKT